MPPLNKTFLMQAAQSCGEDSKLVPRTLLAGCPGCKVMAAVGWCLAGSGTWQGIRKLRVVALIALAV